MKAHDVKIDPDAVLGKKEKTEHLITANKNSNIHISAFINLLWRRVTEVICSSINRLTSAKCASVVPRLN